jgi:hypothetical protein
MRLDESKQTSKHGTSSGAERPKSLFTRTSRAVLLFAIVLAVSIAVQLLPALPKWAIELSLSAVAAVSVHLLDRLVLYKDTADYLGRSLNRVKEDIETAVKHIIATQTASLADQTTSLAAMIRSGIVKIYPSRADAARDLYDDLTDTSNTKIDIIGISLNDFALGHQLELGKAWEAISNYVRCGRVGTNDKGLHIRILVVDPDSLGAILRSSAESREAAPLPGNLRANVSAITDQMLDLVKLAESKNKETGVTFECRLYRTAPISFLCLVDDVCFVEHYHFWSKRADGTPIPVLKYRRDKKSLYPMHEQMEQHFNWIWEKASIDIREFKNQVAVGVDSGMSQSSAVNVYTDPLTARERMLYLLEHAEKNVDIQGISLHSFLRERDRLLGALEDLVRRGGVDIRILFIDPSSEQAKFRSFREALFANPKLTWSEYGGRVRMHETSSLYRDTDMAIRNLRQMVTDVAANDPEPQWTLSLEARTYSTAPHCFLLRVDGSMLVEQYHYGKVAPQGKHATLGKDMPVIEFLDKSPDEDIYKNLPPARWEELRLRRPFRLLKDHFEFAWSLAKKIELQEGPAGNAPDIVAPPIAHSQAESSPVTLRD